VVQVRCHVEFFVQVGLPGPKLLEAGVEEELIVRIPTHAGFSYPIDRIVQRLSGADVDNMHHTLFGAARRDFDCNEPAVRRGVKGADSETPSRAA
jgi:hypothetical protein